MYIIHVDIIFFWEKREHGVGSNQIPTVLQLFRCDCLCSEYLPRSTKVVLYTATYTATILQDTMRQSCDDANELLIPTVSSLISFFRKEERNSSGGGFIWNIFLLQREREMLHRSLWGEGCVNGMLSIQVEAFLPPFFFQGVGWMLCLSLGASHSICLL